MGSHACSTGRGPPKAACRARHRATTKQPQAGASPHGPPHTHLMSSAMRCALKWMGSPSLGAREEAARHPKIGPLRPHPVASVSSSQRRCCESRNLEWNQRASKSCHNTICQAGLLFDMHRQWCLRVYGWSKTLLDVFSDQAMLTNPRSLTISKVSRWDYSIVQRYRQCHSYVCSHAGWG